MAILNFQFLKQWGVLCYNANDTGFEYYLALDTPLGVTCPVYDEVLTEVMSGNSFDNLYDRLLNSTLDRLHVRCLTDDDNVICRPSVTDPFHSECAPGELHVSIEFRLFLFVLVTLPFIPTA